LYSDKLKAAMAEIKVIVQRYDIAANVQLYEDHLSEVLLRVDASWSVARFTGDGKLHIHAKAADFDGDKAAQQRAVELTVGMFTHFYDAAERDLMNMQSVITLLAAQLDIEHDEGIFTPHREH